MRANVATLDSERVSSASQEPTDPLPVQPGRPIEDTAEVQTRGGLSVEERHGFTWRALTPRLVIIIEVDGVLDRMPTDAELRHESVGQELPFGAVPVEDPEGWVHIMRVNFEALDELNFYAALDGVEILWLSRWAPIMEAVSEFVFGGRLAAGRSIVPLPVRPESLTFDGKCRIVAAELERLGFPPVLWIDCLSDQIRADRLRSLIDDDVLPTSRRLLIAPESRTGLDWPEMEAIDSWTRALGIEDT